MLKIGKVGQDAFVTCGSKLFHLSRKLIAGGLIALTGGVLLNMISTEHGYFNPLLDAVQGLVNITYFANGYSFPIKSPIASIAE